VDLEVPRHSSVVGAPRQLADARGLAEARELPLAVVQCWSCLGTVCSSCPVEALVLVVVCSFLLAQDKVQAVERYLWARQMVV